MTTKCNVVSWMGLQNSKMELGKNQKNMNKILTSVNAAAKSLQLC